MSKAILVPPKVLEGIEAVRDSGLTNMFDRSAVVRILKGDLEDHDRVVAAIWVNQHPKEYGEGIMHGFRCRKPRKPVNEEVEDALKERGTFNGETLL